MSRRTAVFLLCCLALAGVTIGERIDRKRQDRAIRGAAERMEQDRVDAGEDRAFVQAWADAESGRLSAEAEAAIKEQ